MYVQKRKYVAVPTTDVIVWLGWQGLLRGGISPSWTALPHPIKLASIVSDSYIITLTVNHV